MGPLPHEWWCKANGAVANTRALLANCPADQIYKPILNIPVTSQSTFVLLMSSLAMVLALAAVEEKDRMPANPTLSQKILGSSKLWLFMTALLGTTFLGYQAFEFTSFVHEGLTIRTNLFGLSWPAPHRVIPNAATDRWCRADGSAKAVPRLINGGSAFLARLPATSSVLRLQAPRMPLFSPIAPTVGMPASAVDRAACYAGQSVLRMNSVTSARQAVAELAAGGQ